MLTLRNRNMPRKGKKIGAEPPSSGGFQVAKALFGDVMHGSVNTSVDPRSCIPLTRIRELSKSGIARLKRIFRGHSIDLSATGGVGESVGFIAGTDTPILMRLEGAYAQYVTEYFTEDKGLADRDARQRVRDRDCWYGVVDGMHRLRAIQELVEEDPERWDGFMWPVTILRGGHPLLVLKQLARHQNVKHSQSQYVETTLYDQLRGLKHEAERLKAETGTKPSGRIVADAYDGCGSYKDRTMQQMANTAVRLSEDVISAIGDIMNTEHPELIRADKSQSSTSTSNEELLSTMDCRVFRRFVNITSLKQATTFMRAAGTGKGGERAQINALYRCRELCRRNGFKPVSHKVVSEQYKMAALAQKECEKFEALLETEPWPEEMETLRHNLLRSTKMDNEISANSGNDTEILECLFSKYKLISPAVSVSKLRKYRASTTASGESEKSDEVEAEPDVTKDPAAPVEILAPETVREDSERTAGERHVKTQTPIPETPNEDATEAAPNVRIPVNRDSENGDEDHIRIDRNDANGENGPVGVTRAEPEVPTQEVAQTAASERLNAEDVDVLESMNIYVHQMKWQEYDRNVLSETTPLFDFIITDPPYGVPDNNPARAGTMYKNFIDDQEMKEFAQFTRRVLLPGGYVFLFTSTRYFYDWVKAFREAGMKPCEYPFVIHKNTKGLQGTRLEDFPQNAAEFAVMVRAPGKASSTFKPNFTSPFQLIQCDQKRRYASVLYSPVPQRKLRNGDSRSPVLTEEKNPTTLAEIMTTFCPINGSVLDCYAGTCTTAIACLMTGRRCVSIEMDPNIYRLATARLRNMANAKKADAQGSKKLRLDGTASGCTHGLGVSVTKETVQTGNIGGALDWDETERHITEECGGEQVMLYSDGEHVGYAVLQSATGAPNGPLQRRIHGEDLKGRSSPSGEGSDLVVILKVIIFPDFKTCPYEYTFPTQDEVPALLSDLLENGVYVWDVKHMTLQHDK